MATTGASTLQLFHVTDQEASTDAVELAPNFSAVLDALRAQDLDGDGTPGLADTLTLSSGDVWIPGLFYDASESIFGSKGAADILIQNELGVQAVAFGNHEFDNGTGIIADLLAGVATEEGLEPFGGADFPYLSANLDFTGDANLQGLVTVDGQDAGAIGGRIAESTVVETAGGMRVGVVGATTPTIDVISSPGPDVGIAPVDFDSNDAADLDALAAEIQTAVDALRAANPELDKVILLAHMQQIAIEQELAERLEHVDVIVAGGSNTRLFDDDDVGFGGEPAQGVYPITKTGADGNPVLIVNTDFQYKYVGRLVVDFDDNGVVIPESYDAAVSGAYATDAAGLARVGAEGLADPEIVAIAEAVNEVIVAGESEFFAVSEVFLNGERQGGGLDGVRTQETNLGNLTADANLVHARQFDPEVVVSIKNGGGIRASIGQKFVPGGGDEELRLPPEGVPGAKPEGGISVNDVANTLAFNNGLSLVSLTTAQLAEVLEHIVGEEDFSIEADSGMGQVGGVRFSFDPDRAPGDRVLSAGVFDVETGELVAEVVEDGEVVDNGARTFRTVTLNFLADGGSGYPFPAFEATSNRVDIGAPEEAPRTGDATFAADGTEQDALAEYLLETYGREPGDPTFAEADTPPELDERIQNLDFRADGVFAGDGVVPSEGDDRRTVAPLDPSAAAGLHLLLVNDDGFDAPGIETMRDALLEAGHDVTVVAPLEQQSGRGTALDADRLFAPVAITEFRPGDVNVDGTPVTTTLAALDFLLADQAPDLVVSGINEGANVGEIAISSGTVSAAVTAILRDVPAIAISADGGEAEEAQSAALTTALVEDLAARQATGQPILPAGTGLNVNVPEGWNGADLAFTTVRGNTGFAFDFPPAAPEGEGDGDDLRYSFIEQDPSGAPDSEAINFTAGSATVSVIDGDWTAAGRVETLETRLDDLSFEDPSTATEALDILLVNDDGFDAPGITTLATALREAGHDVTIVAPLEQQSGRGTDLDVPRLFEVLSVETFAPGDFSVDATPVVVTRAGLQALFDGTPDLLVSGTNQGENVGRSAISSGTVSAAVAGIYAGVPSIAVSAGIDLAGGTFETPEATFDSAAGITVDLVADLLATAGDGPLLPERTGLSVNVPVGDIGGIGFTELDAVTPLGIGFGPVEGGAGLTIDFGIPDVDPRSEGSRFILGDITITPIDGDYTAPADLRSTVEAQIAAGAAFEQVLATGDAELGGDFLGEVVFETGAAFEGREVGGLSALTFDPATGTVFALSDDRSSDARFFSLDIDLADGLLDAGDVVVTDVTTLARADGSPFPEGGIDPEGLAFVRGGGFFLSSEGDADARLDPAIFRLDPEGRVIDELAVDAKFLPTADGASGIRNNLAFESLTLSPDQATLYVATENALAQDGPAAAVDQGSASRIIEYDVATGEAVAEYVYPTGPVAAAPVPADAFATNGLVELLAVDDQGTLLALERSFSAGVGNGIELYRVELQGATDVAGVDALPTEEEDGQLVPLLDQPARKTLLLDFADLGIPLDNIEGMTFGPELADGRQSLVVVSDNNFSDTQFTQFLAFAVDVERVPTVTPAAETPDEIRFPAEAPLVIGHRGASGELPEHTLGSYARAIADGADFIEPDLVSTVDGVLVARHEPWLATVETDEDGHVVRDAAGEPVVTFASTDVATRPEFADRLTTKDIGFSSVTGWFAEDFTLEEIKTLRAVEDQPELRPQSALYDGLFAIPTLDEIIDLVQGHEARTGETIGIYPETKEPTYFDGIGLSLEEKLIETLVEQDFTDPDRVFIQSFEVANLLDLQENVMPAAGVDLPLIQLLFNAPDFATFDLVEEARTDGDFARYASLGFDAETVSGDLFTPEGLATLAEVYAEGIGPSFSLIVEPEGTETSLVDDAQEAGLLVHGYTHANERTFVAEDGTGVSGEDAYTRLLETGVDGIFTDNPATGRAATDAFLAMAGPDPDDPAIWRHPEDAAASVVITAMKNDGLRVYDLDGNELQRLRPDGIRYNNVDLLYGVELGGETVDLAVASDRANDTLAVFEVEARTGLLSDVTADELSDPAFSIFGVDDGEATAYGLATYRSREDGRLYAFTTQADGAAVAQLELQDAGDGTVTAELVRTIALPVPESEDAADFQSEGIAVDRETGIVHVAVEEELGLVRFGAEPSDPGEVEVVADIDAPFFTPDLEGVSILYGRDGAGALVVSSQGDASFAVFDRESYQHLGSFAIGAESEIDGVEDSDGLDIFAGALGDAFPDGLLVTQDGSNEPQVVFGDPDDGEIQNFNVNFKLTDLADVVGRLDLPAPDAAFDPRARVEAGTAGNDVLRADGEGPQILLGEGGNDRLIGGDEFTVLRGGDGRDTVQAGAGGARVVGGGGRDVLIGGEAADVFVLDGDGPDIIGAFDAASDVLELAIAGLVDVELRDVGRNQVVAVDTGGGFEDIATIFGGGVSEDAVLDPFVG